MRQYRVLALGVAIMLALAGQSIVGRAGQAPATAAAGGPFDALHFRPIGPASMSGRISDIAAYEANPAVFYVGTAHGGIWKTVNNGTTFEAQFQDQGLISIGDLAISQSNPDLVWIGTGESNNRQSTSWGDGVYKSADGGKTYTNVGLRTSKHINRVVIDPRANDIVFVAATGPLFGPGGERGVYKTIDAGKTWRQVLKVDDETGANDLVMDPANSQVLYASTYQRRRTEVLGEVLALRHREEGGAGREFGTSGFYVQASHRFGRLTPYYRFEGLDRGADDPYYPSSADLRRHIAGLRADPWSSAAVKVELSRDAPDPGPSFSAATLQVAFTF